MMKDNIFEAERKTLREWIDRSATLSWDMADKFREAFDASVERIVRSEEPLWEKIATLSAAGEDFGFLLGAARCRRADGMLLHLIRYCIVSLANARQLAERYPEEKTPPRPSLRLNPDYSKTDLLELLRKLHGHRLFLDGEGRRCPFSVVCDRFGLFLGEDLHNHRRLLSATGIRYKKPFPERIGLELPDPEDRRTP